MSFIQYASGIGGVIKYFSTQLICIQTRTQVQCRYFKYYSNIFAYTHTRLSVWFYNIQVHVSVRPFSEMRLLDSC